VLVALAVPEADAEVQADALVEADLRGFPSHGIQRLSVLAARIRNGVTAPVTRCTMRWLTDAAVAVDGGRGLGPVVAFTALAALQKRAKSTGVAIGLMTDCSHLGMLAPYVERVAGDGQICLALTTSEALVHPFGGHRALIGTNPLAVGIPSRPTPFVLDMATGKVSMGRILEHRHRGAPIPPGWAVDSAGRVTTDPVAVVAISPFGGAKGFGLGLAFELLVAALTGSELGARIVGTLDTTEICNKGDVFMCLDPAVLGVDMWDNRFTAYLDEIRGGGQARGDVRIPGERSRELRARRLVEGIPLASAVWDDARRLDADPVSP
jgi:LDH2 family malate/lactate/ureidoglycolate dehydrogenase